MEIFLHRICGKTAEPPVPMVILVAEAPPEQAAREMVRAAVRARVNSFLIFITGFLLFVGSWLSKNFMAVLYYRFCIFAR